MQLKLGKHSRRGSEEKNAGRSANCTACAVPKPRVYVISFVGTFGLKFIKIKPLESPHIPLNLNFFLTFVKKIYKKFSFNPPKL